MQDRTLQWFGHLESMEEIALSSKYRTFKVNGNFPTRERPRKTQNEVIISDLKERKVRKDLANCRNCKFLKRDHQTHANLEKRR